MTRVEQRGRGHESSDRSSSHPRVSAVVEPWVNSVLGEHCMAWVFLHELMAE
jgi:hypothetical protein